MDGEKINGCVISRLWPPGAQPEVIRPRPRPQHGALRGLAVRKGLQLCRRPARDFRPRGFSHPCLTWSCVMPSFCRDRLLNSFTGRLSPFAPATKYPRMKRSQKGRATHFHVIYHAKGRMGNNSKRSAPESPDAKCTKRAIVLRKLR